MYNNMFSAKLSFYINNFIKEHIIIVKLKIIAH